MRIYIVCEAPRECIVTNHARYFWRKNRCTIQLVCFHMFLVHQKHHCYSLSRKRFAYLFDFLQVDLQLVRDQENQRKRLVMNFLALQSNKYPKISDFDHMPSMIYPILVDQVIPFYSLYAQMKLFFTHKTFPKWHNRQNHEFSYS